MDDLSFSMNGFEVCNNNTKVNIFLYPFETYLIYIIKLKFMGKHKLLTNKFLLASKNLLKFDHILRQGHCIGVSEIISIL
jgi:hypothetical protein